MYRHQEQTTFYSHFSLDNFFIICTPVNFLYNPHVSINKQHIVTKTDSFLIDNLSQSWDSQTLYFNSCILLLLFLSIFDATYIYILFFILDMLDKD